MSNINTLKGMKEKDKKDDKDDNQQAFYAGGSDRSGQEILGPPTNKTTDDIIKDIFKSARDAGAQQLEHEDEDFPPSPPTTFPGQGFRLDSQPGQSTHSKAESEKKKETSSKPMLRKLKLWKNGFSIDDGELRSYDTPENAEFLASVKRGEVPRELVNEARESERSPGGISINISNHSHEDYVPPKKSVQSFVGEGHRLGNPTPEFGTFNEPKSPSEEKKNEDDAIKQLNTDKEKPTTKIQVRLADGTKLVVVMNLTHTINDLRMFIVNSRPHYAVTPFSLSTSFPPKELTDETLTISDAKLQGAVVIQKFK